MKILDKISNQILRLLQTVTNIFLVIMLSITFIQVIMRYVLNKPFVWAEEVTLAILIWFAYFSIAIAIKNENHMTIDFFYDRANKKIQLFLDLVKDIMMIGFSSLMAFYGFQMVQNASGKVLPASQFSRSILFIPIFLGGILIVFFTILQMIHRWMSRKGEDKE